MNIVIVGAGSIGLHIAKVLSQLEHNILLVDVNQTKLTQASNGLDVATFLGSGTSWELLDELKELSPDMLLAVTHDDNINLVTCSIAKNLGYPITVAKIKNLQFINQSRLDFLRIFYIDHFIAPEILAARDIMKCILNLSSHHIENFALGAAQMRIVSISENWEKNSLPLKKLNKELPQGMMIGLIKRKKDNVDKIIFPHGNDCILPEDEVTFIGKTEMMQQLNHYLKIPEKKVSSILIIGGTLIGIELARLLLSKNIFVKIVDSDHNHCEYLAQLLPEASIIHQNTLNLEFYKSEQIHDLDAIVACTRQDELNAFAAVLAKEVGCKQIIVTVSDSNLTQVLHKIGINHIISPTESAASHILSIAKSEKASSIISLYDNQAEIMEIKVSSNSKLTGIPLSVLGPRLPNDFLIALIQNRGKIMIANGNKVLSPQDTVIVIGDPKYLEQVRDIF